MVMMCFNFFGFSKNGHDDLLGIKGHDGIGDNGRPNSSSLVAFSYSYIGSVRGGSYTYAIEDNTFTYELMGHDEYEGLTVSVDEELLGRLKDLYIEAESYKWDGYSKYATNVLDGDGFSISFRFEDGQSCSANGSNCKPKNYALFCGGMQGLLKPLADDIAEQGKQKKIAEGFPGKVDNILMNFTQQGTSGDDEYSFHIYPTDFADVNNLDIRIHSVSEEFFPAGDYRYFGHIDNRYIDFSKLDELIEQYKLVYWIDYDVAAEDYNNAEWFQISIGFDDDKYLSAMGTEKPEHYDAFRQEFLSYMVQFIEDIKDVYEPYKE